jgi:hypothetical protein
MTPTSMHREQHASQNVNTAQGNTFQNGFVALCQKDDFFLPNFISYHHTIHQEPLCMKVPHFEHVMKTVTKIINSIKAASMQYTL